MIDDKTFQTTNNNNSINSSRYKFGDKTNLFNFGETELETGVNPG